jgi:hypothetical protein
MRFAALCLTLWLGTLPLSARADIPSPAWQTFLKESMAQYQKVDPNDFEDQLYLAASNGASEADAVTDFARRMKIDPAWAEDDAELIVATVNYVHDCREDCHFRAGMPVYDAAARVALAEPTGRLLEDVVHDLRYWDEADQVELISRHPAAVSVFLRLYDYGGNSSFLGAALLKLPDDPPSMPPVLGGQRFSNTPDELSGLIPAIIESTEARLANSPTGTAWRGVLAQWALEQDLSMGLDDEAVSRYLAYPPAVRGQIPYAPAIPSEWQRCNQMSDSFALADDLAAALWSTGHRSEAKALLAYRYPQAWQRNAASQAEFDMVSDAMTPSIADKDLFKLYIEGRPASGYTKLDVCGIGSTPGFDGQGWLFTTAERTSALRHLIAGRLSGSVVPMELRAYWSTSPPISPPT